jgi:DNA-directed RNA polymerase subunit H (RpoH/RPB5)
MNASQLQGFKLYQDVYNSRKHLLEMLEDRGYNVDHLKNYTSDEIKTMLSEHKIGKFDLIADIGPLDIFLEKKASNSNSKNKKTDDVDTITSMMSTAKIDTKVNPATEKIYVKYRLEPKFKGTASVKTQISEIYENHLTTKDTLIIININRLLMKVGAKEKTDEDFVNDLYTTKNYFIQLFGLENFLINISHHQFVPKHRVLSPQETQDLLSKYNCTIKNIPTIKRDDPQAKYIGLRLKQICEITRENITSGTTITYRLCIS